MDNKGLVAEANVMDSLLESYINKLAADSNLTTYNGVNFGNESFIGRKVHQGVASPFKFDLLGFKGDKVFYHVQDLEYDGVMYENDIVSFNYKEFSKGYSIVGFEADIYDRSLKQRLDTSVDFNSVINESAKRDLDLDDSYKRQGIQTERPQSHNTFKGKTVTCFKEKSEELLKFIKKKRPSFADIASETFVAEYLNSITDAARSKVTLAETRPTEKPEEFLSKYQKSSFTSHKNRLYLSNDNDGVALRFRVIPEIGVEDAPFPYPNSKSYILVFSDHAVAYKTSVFSERVAEIIEERLNIITNIDDMSNADTLKLKRIMDELADCGYFSSHGDIKVILSADKKAEQEAAEKERERLRREREEERRRREKYPDNTADNDFSTEDTDTADTYDDSLIAERIIYVSKAPQKTITLPVLSATETEGVNVDVKKVSVLIKVYNEYDDDGYPLKGKFNPYYFDITNAYTLSKFFKKFDVTKTFTTSRGEEVVYFNKEVISSPMSSFEILELDSSSPTIEPPNLPGEFDLKDKGLYYFVEENSEEGAREHLNIQALLDGTIKTEEGQKTLYSLIEGGDPPEEGYLARSKKVSNQM